MSSRQGRYSCKNYSCCCHLLWQYLEFPFFDVLLASSLLFNSFCAFMPLSLSFQHLWTVKSRPIYMITWESELIMTHQVLGAPKWCIVLMIKGLIYLTTGHLCYSYFYRKLILLSWIAFLGFFHVGPVKMGSHSLLNGTKVKAPQKEFTMDWVNVLYLLCNSLQPGTSFWLLVIII